MYKNFCIKIEILRYDKDQYYYHMTKTTKLVRDDDNVFHIEIPEEFVTKLNWRHGFVLKIDSDDSKVTVEKLSGFMGK